MSIHEVMLNGSYRLEKLREVRRDIERGHRVGRPPVARAMARGLRKIATALDGEPAPRYAPAR